MKRFSTFGFAYFLKKIEEIYGFILQREELDHCVTKVTHYTPRPSLQNKRTDLTCDYENKGHYEIEHASERQLVLF